MLLKATHPGLRYTPFTRSNCDLDCNLHLNVDCTSLHSTFIVQYCNLDKFVSCKFIRRYGVDSTRLFTASQQNAITVGKASL